MEGITCLCGAIVRGYCIVPVSPCAAIHRLRSFRIIATIEVISELSAMLFSPYGSICVL